MDGMIKQRHLLPVFLMVADEAPKFLGWRDIRERSRGS